MQVCKLTVMVNQRPIESLIRVGSIATVETGRLNDDVKEPEDRISISINDADEGPVAWVQVGKFGSNKSLTMVNEGWVRLGDNTLSGFGNGEGISATLELVNDAAEKTMQSLGQVKHGTLACCTARGNGCYVECCNSCCSDPTRCPGASCCA